MQQIKESTQTVAQYPGDIEIETNSLSLYGKFC